MPRTKAWEKICRRQIDVDVAAGGDEGAVVVDEERAVELSELLDGLAKVGQLGVQKLGRMAVKRVEQQRSRARKDVLDVADDEKRADLAPLASFAGELDRQLDDGLESGLADSQAAGALGTGP